MLSQPSNHLRSCGCGDDDFYGMSPFFYKRKRIFSSLAPEMTTDWIESCTYADKGWGNCFFCVVNAGTRWMQQGLSTFYVMSPLYYKVNNVPKCCVA